MAINLRQVGMESYVTETRRVRGKLVQTYLGSDKNPLVRFLYRKSVLQKAIARSLREEAKSIRERNRYIERLMKLIVTLAGHVPILTQLSAKPRWESKPMPNTNADSNAKITANKPDEETIKQAMEILPAKRAFGQLCRKADAGDADATAKLDELIEKAPGLLDSMGDLIRFARESVMRGISGDSVVFTAALNARIDEMEDIIKADHIDDPILGMAAETVVVTYLDAMRCSLLALKGQVNNSEAERVQGLADRSLKRFVGMQQTYHRLCQQKQRSQTATRSRKPK